MEKINQYIEVELKNELNAIQYELDNNKQYLEGYKIIQLYNKKHEIQDKQKLINIMKENNISEKEVETYSNFCKRNNFDDLGYKEYKKLQEIKQENNLSDDDLIFCYKHKTSYPLTEILEYFKLLDKCKNFDDEKLKKIKNIKHFVKYKNNKTIPLKYKNFVIDDFKINSIEEKKIKDYVIEYLDNAIEHYLKPTSIFFYGNYGTGKTMLMSIMASELNKKYGFNAIFIDTTKMINDLFKSYGDENTNANEILDSYAKADFLCLDDFDKIKVTEHIQEKIYYIIDYRYSNNLPTFITSNIDMEILEKKMGEAITSRIYEISKILEFKQKNYRLQNNNG